MFYSKEIKEAAKRLFLRRCKAKEIQARLAGEKIKVGADKEIIALIAYLQRLGTDIAKK